MEAVKIMIGYDGSPHSEAALADLSRAGLPRKVEAMVLCGFRRMDSGPGQPWRRRDILSQV
jgi:hypothetical protein